MTKEEVATEARRRGYASREQAKLYAKRHKKEDYTEEDLMELYDITEQNDYRFRVASQNVEVVYNGKAREY